MPRGEGAIGLPRHSVAIGPATLQTALILPVDPSDAGIMLAELVEDQTLKILDNLDAILAQTGAARSDVLFCRLYVAGYKRFIQRVRRVFDRHFAASPPLVSELGVSELPRGALVGIEVLIARP